MVYLCDEFVFKPHIHGSTCRAKGCHFVSGWDVV